ncbi:MAG: hypothetical protein IIW23_01940 [Clostridia bacterium]|nr:hypothetical protein [Clostridia bacterium]
MIKFECEKCGNEFRVEPFANTIVFCDSCHWGMCESDCGFGPVTPCVVYVGDKKVGMVTLQDSVYRFDSDAFGIHMELKERYQDALREVMKIVGELL